MTDFVPQKMKMHLNIDIDINKYKYKYRFVARDGERRRGGRS